MELESLLCFFLLVQLRQAAKSVSPGSPWEEWLKRSLIFVGGLFVLDILLPHSVLFDWAWHLLLLAIIGLAFRYSLFTSVRTVMYAILPLSFLYVFSDAATALVPSWSTAVDRYETYAYPAAFTWLIAVVALWRKQRKTIKAEAARRWKEEEERRQMEARKAELEELVNERTAELVRQKDELHHALHDLRETQDQLIQKEKMASLGELTAGIAHEIKNPLNFVNNFSELSVELAGEVRQHIERLAIPAAEKDELVKMLNELEQNQDKIHYHGRRADAIVKSMLLHSQKNTGQREKVNLNALADEYLRLTYHGIRAKDKTFNATLKTAFDENIGEVALVPQDIGRVLMNLLANAFYAVQQKKARLNGTYEPIVSLTTQKINSAVSIRIKDNGTGIPQPVVDKIFQPFFTTKPTGEGTGLGLSLSYDIVTKGHGGKLMVETTEGEGAVFDIVLPTS